jgi:hypothetical protein
MPTPAVTSADICERVTAVIEALTPSSAPVVGFVRHTDRTTKLENVTDPGRLRLLEIRIEDPKIGQYSAKPGTTQSNFTALLAVYVGYSLEVYETLDGVEYFIQDLIDQDLEQIRRALDSSTLFDASGDLAALVGVKLQRFEGALLVSGGKKHKITYSINYGRAY